MKQNLHTHSIYCDGKNTIKEMIALALHKDFDVLGFSGHSLTGFDKSYCMSEEGIRDYIAEVTAAKNHFRNDPDGAKEFFAPDLKAAKDLSIYLGIEQDLYSDDPALRSQNGILNPGSMDGVYDYIIGSTHAFHLIWDEIRERRGTNGSITEPDMNGVIFSDDGVYIYVDYDAEVFKWAKDEVYGGDTLAIAEDYFRDEARIVSATDCDIVGHFDLLLKFNESGDIFDVTSPRYRKARDMALDKIFNDFRAKGRKPIFEVNTGAMARGYRSVPYPSPESLSEIRDRGGLILINSDCHNAGLLDYGFEEARKIVLGSGFSSEIIGIPGGKLEIFV